MRHNHHYYRLENTFLLLEAELVCNLLWIHMNTETGPQVHVKLESELAWKGV